MKKRVIILSLCGLLLPSVMWACTNFLAGKKATVDGSTLITYSADSYVLYGALYHYPATTYPAGTMREVYEWDSGKYLGQIPEAPQTYSVIGNINEHQLTIAETTFGGRTELIDTLGLLDYGSLIYIALQRCRTAREAIQLITDLVAKYGYYSSGESFSIGDPNEIWVLEMIGKGVGRKGAVWVAQRIPDDCVSAHANQARITTIDFKDKENVLYSQDVISFAREMGYFDGKDKEFSFSDVYNPLDFPGVYACEARVWSFFRQIDPAMDKYYTYVVGKTKERMPLYLKPVKKVSAQDFKRLMRDQYEGTPLDMTKGAAAGPWGSKLRYGSLSFQVDSVKCWHQRPIATQQTAFSFVSQMRGYVPNKTGGVLWFGVDDAATTLYVPIYSVVNKVPECFDLNNGSILDYSPTSAFWIYNTVANFAYSKFSAMYPEIKSVQHEWETFFNQMIPAMDEIVKEMSAQEAQRTLTLFSMTQAQQSTAAWKKLSEYLLVKYLDGQEKKMKEGKFLQNDQRFPPGVVRPAYPESYLRTLVEETRHE